jgi:hypothetical protein
MIPTDRHGFTITQTFVSPVTNRTVGSPQGVEVTHPAFPVTARIDSLRLPSPLGWCKSRREAMVQIDALHARAHGSLDLTQALGFSREHWEHLAVFWPEAPNPPQVLAAMSARDEADAIRAAADAERIAQEQRYVRFGPELVQALERLMPDAQIASAGYQSTPLVAARTLLRKVRGELTADGRVA